MFIQIASDLHLQTISPDWSRVIKPQCDIVAILGDTCELYGNKALWCSFVEYLSKNWQTVLLLNGNHEFYNHHKCSMEELLDLQQLWLKQLNVPNVHLLENSHVDVDDVRIVGCTLWSYVPKMYQEEVETYVNDYRYMYTSSNKLVTVTETNAKHIESVRYLDSVVCDAGENNKRLIILTHHAPLMAGTSDPIYEKQKNRGMNFAFASELSGLMKPCVRAWCFGHTHFKTDFIHGTTRVLSNPRGYGRADPCYEQYNPGYTFEI